MLPNRKPQRLQCFDYSTPGWYFVTICTHEMNAYFGSIKDGKILLNDMGSLVDKNWRRISELHPDIELDEFIVMPNHIHGIVIIDVVTANLAVKRNDVGDANFASPTNDRTKMKLSVIIQQFKRVCTIQAKEIKIHHEGNLWQRSFYDRIIRNEKELYNIRKYIQQNPLKWDLEKSVDNIDL